LNIHPKVTKSIAETDGTHLTKFKFQIRSCRYGCVAYLVLIVMEIRLFPVYFQ